MFAFIAIVLIASVGFIVRGVLRRTAYVHKPIDPIGTESNSTYAALPSIIPWTGSGDCDFNIVGESHYQPALAKIAGPTSQKTVRHPCKALLQMEPDNFYDPYAVAVFIQGLKVGYLPRAAAANFTQTIAREFVWVPPKQRRRLEFEVDAIIFGGRNRVNPDGSQSPGLYGVKIDLEDDDDFDE